MLILVVAILSACLVPAFCSRLFGKRHARYVNARVPEGEVAAPSHEVHMHVGNSFVFWALLLTVVGMLGYFGVWTAAYRAVVEHQGYFESSMPSVPTFGHNKPYVQKADATRAHAPTQATHRPKPKHAKHKPDPIVELLKRNQ